MTGNTIASNKSDGVALEAANASTLAANVIMGNASRGVAASGLTNLNVTGNTIASNSADGIALNGVAASTLAANTVTNQTNGAGVRLTNLGGGVSVGVSGAGNTISGNGSGVAVSGSGGSIRFNSISDNAGQGIDWNANGLVDVNTATTDQFRPDYPIITQIVNGVAVGWVRANPGQLFTIDLYANADFDIVGGNTAVRYGEGATWLSSVVTAVADARGYARFAIPVGGLQPGQKLSATATTVGGVTSEFSGANRDPGVYRLIDNSVVTFNSPFRNDPALEALLTPEYAWNSVTSAAFSQNPNLIQAPRDSRLDYGVSTLNLLQVYDPDDSGIELYTVTVSVQFGRLTKLGEPSVAGAGQSSVTFQGTLEQINLGIRGLSYRPNSGFSAEDRFTVQIFDGANPSIVASSGRTGSATGADRFQVTGDPVFDVATTPPIVTTTQVLFVPVQFATTVTPVQAAEVRLTAGGGDAASPPGVQVSTPELIQGLGDVIIIDNRDAVPARLKQTAFDGDESVDLLRKLLGDKAKSQPTKVGPGGAVPGPAPMGAVPEAGPDAPKSDIPESETPPKSRLQGETAESDAPEVTISRQTIAPKAEMRYDNLNSASDEEVSRRHPASAALALLGSLGLGGLFRRPGRRRDTPRHPSI